MMRNTFLAIMLALCIVLFASCSQPEPYGNLTIDFANSKSILPISVDVTWIRVTGSKNNSSISFSAQDFQLGSTINITGLSVGTWTFNVVGYDGNPASEDSTVLTSIASDANVNIQSGMTTSASFALHYLTSGVGGCDLTVYWPESLPLFSKVEATVGASTIEGTIGSSSATFTGSLAVGDHPLGFIFTNPLGTEIEFANMEMVNVYSNLISTGSVTFDPADFIQIPAPFITTNDVDGGQQVSLSCATSEVAIYYTTDGSDPTTSETKVHYVEPFTIFQTKTIRAVAIKTEMVNSAELNQEVIVAQVATPVMTPSEVTFSGTVEVSINTTTSGATIHYTTDGSDPTNASPTYENSFTIHDTTTIKAMAIKSGMIQSAIASRMYTLQLPTYVVGDTGPAGGKIFYVNDNPSITTWKYLEAAPADETNTYVYGGSGTLLGALTQNTAVGAGQASTDEIVRILGTSTDYAAKACNDKSITNNDVVYTDWFLPSRDELIQMYSQIGNDGSFTTDAHYWSSSEETQDESWSQIFNNGAPYTNNKTELFRVRAVRAFL